LQGLSELTKVIFHKAQPKRMNNSIITGPMLAALTEAYVDAINKGAVPTIATAWQVWLNSSLHQHLVHSAIQGTYYKNTNLTTTRICHVDLQSVLRFILSQAACFEGARSLTSPCICMIGKA
jgi:hypothetical protein